MNIAEILKDCPKGMELDCTMFDNVTFETICEKDTDFPIWIKYGNDGMWRLSKYGCETLDKYAKCVIFPKGKTSWKGFQRPFKDGDIVIDSLGGIHIMQNSSTSYCYFDRLGVLDKSKTTCVRVVRLATEEEKQKLFDAIKAKGYKWNAETKTLEKLIVPKFKVGDRIKDKNNFIYTILSVESWGYMLDDIYRTCISLDKQDNWELVPNKFDISTLKPFESRVLTRQGEKDCWKPAFWGKYVGGSIGFSFITTYGATRQCIPYV